MNYLRIDHSFINLRQVEDILPKIRDDQLIDIIVTYKSGRETVVTCEIDIGVDINEAIDVLCDGIMEAIQSCADADCENIEDYVEEAYG